MAQNVWKMGQGLETTCRWYVLWMKSLGYIWVNGYDTILRYHNFQNEIDVWESTVP